MSLSEIKTSSAATPREMALAQIKESEKMINEAGGPSCISGGLSILRGALLYVARNNTLSNTVPSIVSVLRDTSLALTMGPVTEAYSEYTGAVTDIQIPIGSEGEPKNVFLALPTAENAIVDYQYTDSVPNIPDNFLTRTPLEEPTATFIPKEAYAATLLQFVDGIRYQTKAPEDEFGRQQKGYAIIMLTDLALACFSGEKIQAFPKDLADSLSKAPKQFKREFYEIVMDSVDVKVNSIVNKTEKRLSNVQKTARRNYVSSNAQSTARNIGVSVNYNGKDPTNKRIECLELVHRKLMEVVPKHTKTLLNKFMDDGRLHFGECHPAINTMVNYQGILKYADSRIADAQTDRASVEAFVMETMEGLGFTKSKTVSPDFDAYSCEALRTALQELKLKRVPTCTNWAQRMFGDNYFIRSSSSHHPRLSGATTSI